jgi:hypothetical protein
MSNPRILASASALPISAVIFPFSSSEIKLTLYPVTSDT